MTQSASVTDFDAPMSPRQRQALLQDRFPDFEIWYVPKAVGGGFTWCGRRRGEANLLNTLHADKPGELAGIIEQELAERSEQRKAADAFRPSPRDAHRSPGRLIHQSPIMPSIM